MKLPLEAAKQMRPEEEKRRFPGACGNRYSGGYYGPSGRKPYSCKRGTFSLPHTKNKGLKALNKSNWLEIRNQFLRYWFPPWSVHYASGRLDTAMRSLSLLQCEDEEEAAKLAKRSESMNDSRKALTEQGTELLTS